MLVAEAVQHIKVVLLVALVQVAELQVEHKAVMLVLEQIILVAAAVVLKEVQLAQVEQVL
jgi:hypothetical protein